MSECSLNGRGQGHVSNFYIMDLENFATSSRQYTGDIHNTSVVSLFMTPTEQWKYTGDIHNTSVVSLFMTPTEQWKWLDCVMVECTCLLHIAPL